MSIPERPNVVLERTFVLEIGTTTTIPEFATILLMRTPVPLDCEGLSAFSTREWLGTVLSFVVRLEGSKVFQGLSSRVVDVVLAALGTTIAR